MIQLTNVKLNQPKAFPDFKFVAHRMNIDDDLALADDQIKPKQIDMNKYNNKFKLTPSNPH